VGYAQRPSTSHDVAPAIRQEFGVPDLIAVDEPALSGGTVHGASMSIPTPELHDDDVPDPLNPDPLIPRSPDQVAPVNPDPVAQDPPFKPDSLIPVNPDEQKEIDLHQQNPVISGVDTYILTISSSDVVAYEAHLVQKRNELNATYFKSKLPMIHVAVGTLTGAAVMGQYTTYWDHGIRGEIRLNITMFNGGVRWTNPEDGEGFLRLIDDVLLHELVHAYLDLINDERQARHQQAFTDECNRIGDLLHLPRVNSDRSRNEPKSKHWPHCVRPHGYYGTAYNQDEQEDSAQRRRRPSDVPLDVFEPGVNPYEVLKSIMDLIKLADPHAAGLKDLVRRILSVLGRCSGSKEVGSHLADYLEPKRKKPRR